MSRAPKPLAPTLRAAFETLAESSKLSEPVRAQLLREFDEGRMSRVEKWAQRLEGEPHVDRDRSTGHARCLSDDVRADIATIRRVARRAA